MPGKLLFATHSSTQCLPKWINTCLRGVAAVRGDHASPSLSQLGICSWEGSSPDLWQWLLQGSHSKMCSLENVLTAQLIWLALPFPSLPIPRWIYPGSKPAPERPRQNVEMGKRESAFGIFCALCLTLTDSSSSGHWFRLVEQMRGGKCSTQGNVTAVNKAWSAAIILFICGSASSFLK